MSVLHALSRAIFTGERSWAWRRRVAFAGCAVFLAGVVHAVWFEPSEARAQFVLVNCGTFFGATFAAYAGLAVADSHLKRESERKAATTP